MDYDTDYYEDEDEFDDYWDYEDYYNDTDGYPDEGYEYVPPSRRQLFVWSLQVLAYRLRHPVCYARQWRKEHFWHCPNCGKLFRNCDCIPF